MKRISYSSLAFAAVVALGLMASSLAIAAGTTCPGYTPSPNSAIFNLRIWNDCPFSNLTTVNNYPVELSIRDRDEGCTGWAGFHAWHFSENGTDPAIFENCSHYKFSTTFSIVGGGGNAEGGLIVAPWWAPNEGGYLMVNTDGQIRAWGGGRPAFLFDVAFGIHYVINTPIWMEITYTPHSLTEADPATIVYHIYYQGQDYCSPELPFGIGNESEGAEHGIWGELYPVQVGGYYQAPHANGGAAYDLTAKWGNINFEGPAATPTGNRTWGQLKSLYR
jgi:hypothetical protein